MLMFLGFLLTTSCGYLHLNISGNSPSISVGSGTNNNDSNGGSELKISLSSQTVAAKEGASLQFTVSLNQPAPRDITFTYTTRSATAVENLDFVPFQGVFTIPAGQTEAIITIPTIARSGYQGDRALDFVITNVIGIPGPNGTSGSSSASEIKETAVIKEVQVKPGVLLDINRTPDQLPATYFNGFVFFVNFQEGTGFELWRTNGQITELVKDINPGSESAFTIGDNERNIFVEMGGNLYFSAQHRDFGLELWKTDGTAAGTQMVTEIRPGAADGLSNRELLGALNNSVYFSGFASWSREGLYKSDGTAAGTQAVLTSVNGIHDSSYDYGRGFVYNGVMYYAGIWDLYWDRARLTRTDGTEAGTYMVKDTNPNGRWRRSDPITPTVCNGKIFFGTEDHNNEATGGDELWISDGTTTGTTMLRDIEPGNGSSFPKPIACLKNKLIFRATTTTNGEELWISNGTSAGTVLLKDINPGNVSTGFVGGHGPDQRKRNFAVVGDVLYFYAQTPEYGMELWRTDGTTSGTTLVKDIFPGPTSSYPHSLTNAGGMLAFVANDGAHGFELWRSDGSESGTQLVIDLNAGAAPSAPENFVYVPGNGGVSDRLFMTAATSENAGARVVWTQLTASTTVVDSSIKVPTEGGNPNSFFNLGNKLFFQADDGRWTQQIWEADGTIDGTKLMLDLSPNSGCFSLSMVYTPNFGNQIKLIFAEDAEHGRELWQTDGTVEGTHLFKDIYPGPTSSGVNLQMSDYNRFSDGRWVFSANDGVHGQELWITDGTPEGTTLFLDVVPGSEGIKGWSGMSNLGDGRFIIWIDTATYGSEPWITDGTPAGTHLLKDLSPGISSSMISGWSPFTQIAPNLYIMGIHMDSTGGELWVTDGTTSGTKMLKDFYPGTIMGNQITGLLEFCGVVNGKMVLVARTATQGQELWVTDGTAAGTVILRDIVSGAGGGGPDSLFLSPDKSFLLFTAQDAVAGREIWRTDGTTNGTYRLGDINPGPSESRPGQFAKLPDGKWVFDAEDSIRGRELWVTDGVSVSLLKDINIGAESSAPIGLRLFNGKVFFAATSAEYGQALWTTDGTTDGTVLFKDINDQLATIEYSVLNEFYGRLYFVANDGIHGKELWSTDGTTTGTKLEFDSNPGAGSMLTYIQQMQAINGAVYFLTSTPMEGQELFLVYPQ